MIEDQYRQCFEKLIRSGVVTIDVGVMQLGEQLLGEPNRCDLGSENEAEGGVNAVDRDHRDRPTSVSVTQSRPRADLIVIGFTSASTGGRHRRSCCPFGVIPYVSICKRNSDAR